MLTPYPREEAGQGLVLTLTVSKRILTVFPFIEDLWHSSSCCGDPKYARCLAVVSGLLCLSDKQAQVLEGVSTIKQR